MLAPLLFLLAIPFVSSQRYYADVTIDVDTIGLARISGLTNHPGLTGETHEYTFKDGETWLLNITLEGTFSDFVYEVVLPPGAVINYLNVPSTISIGNEGGRIVLTGTGKDDSFFVVVQYSFSQHDIFDPLTFAAGAVLIGIAGIIYFVMKKKPHAIDDMLSLTERQKLIVNFVRKRGEVTQREIEKGVNIPKSSVSRNINTLAGKGILVRERKGMSNIIFLK